MHMSIRKYISNRQGPLGQQTNQGD